MGQVSRYRRVTLLLWLTLPSLFLSLLRPSKHAHWTPYIDVFNHNRVPCLTQLRIGGTWYIGPQRAGPDSHCVFVKGNIPWDRVPEGVIVHVCLPCWIESQGEFVMYSESDHLIPSSESNHVWRFRSSSQTTLWTAALRRYKPSCFEASSFFIRQVTRSSSPPPPRQVLFIIIGSHGFLFRSGSLTEAVEGP